MIPAAMGGARALPRTSRVLGASLLLLAGLGGAAWLWIRHGQGPAPGPASADGRPIPKIDVHVHIAPSVFDEAVAALGESGVELALNASGGEPGRGLERSRAAVETTHGHLRPYCNVDLVRAVDEGAAYVVPMLERCKRDGGVGLKIPKSLGLGLIDAGGGLVAVDDPRLDVLFETCGRLGLPVLLHSGDPKAFFRPPTPDNERYDELSVHPGWSFWGPRPDGHGEWPGWDEVFAQFERRVARHPGTTIVGAHFGNDAEDPAAVGRMLARYPRYVIDTAARVPEFGRHPAPAMRAFFERWQDRILFGSDLGVGPPRDDAPGGPTFTLGSGGRDPGRRDEVRPFFDAHWRYFETRGRRLATPTPIQGRWTIDGIGLSRAVLEKVYWRNAARIFHVSLPAGASYPGEAARSD